jgi:hypothetical protein
MESAICAGGAVAVGIGGGVAVCGAGTGMLEPDPDDRLLNIDLIIESAICAGVDVDTGALTVSA